MPPLNELAAKRFDAASTYADKVHFVHINVIEPHPRGDPSPYTGSVWEQEFSSVGQPEDYSERVGVAGQIAPLITGDQLLLVDELTPDGPDNPFWCTYGTTPNSGYLIRQDGVIETAQVWIDVPEMERAIDSLLGG